MEESARAKAEAKRVLALSRNYRQGTKRWEVLAIKPNEYYRVTSGGVSHHYYARSCDDAMTQHRKKWS